MEQQAIARHGIVVRIIHWVFAISGAALAITGFAHIGPPEYPPLHIMGAVVFTLTILVHAIYHAVRGEFAMIPKKGDLGKISQSDRTEDGKYFAKQRLIYLAVGIVSLMMVGSGILKMVNKAMRPPEGSFQIILSSQVHSIGAILFVLLAAIHVAAFVLKPNRPLVRSMLTGKVDREYAEERYPLWVKEQEQS
jgi:cytochrome b subunit of formate dehydrogenase